ncbi:hypothetical protein PUN28_020801 [Cardiocondyla obscurior]|uniref:Uncharacterized protein n=1 Tax=Cardiocondyla obscurior TaxID=286306 RepID=A0AAW2E5A3_9HYME
MNEILHKKIRRGKKKKKVITPAFLPSSPESEKENKPRIIQIEDFRGKIRILPKRNKLDEEISLLSWKLTPLERSSKKTRPPRLALEEEDARKRRTTNPRWHLETEKKLLRRLQPRSKEIAVQAGQPTQEIRILTEVSTQDKTTQTEERENYPLKYPGDDK